MNQEFVSTEYKTGITGVEFLNIIFMCLYSALIVYTPMFEYKRYVYLAILLVAWAVTALIIDPTFIMKMIVISAFIIAIFSMDSILFIMKDEYDVMNTAISKVFNFSALMFFAFYCDKLRLLKEAKWVIIFMVIITSIYTLKGNIEHPEASRFLAIGTGNSERTDAYRAEYRSYNIGGYDIVYSIVFFVLPLLVFGKAQGIKSFVFMIVLTAILYATIIVSSYTIGIILATVMIILPFTKMKKLVRLFLAMGLIALLAYIFREEILKLAVNVSLKIGGGNILAVRAEQLLTGKYFIEFGDDRNRLTIFMNTIQNWLDRPFLGALQGGIITERRSGHSAMLGYLESYGLLSMICFTYYYVAYKNVIKSIATESIKAVYKVYFLIFILFTIIDTFDPYLPIGFNTLFFGPILLLMADEKIKKKEEISNENAA